MRYIDKTLFAAFTLNSIRQSPSEQIAISLAFQQIILGTALHCLQGEIFIVVATKHDNEQRRLCNLNLVKGVQSLCIWQVKVE